MAGIGDYDQNTKTVLTALFIVASKKVDQKVKEQLLFACSMMLVSKLTEKK